MSLLLAAAGVIGAAGVGVLSHGAFHPRAQLFGPVIFRGPSDSNAVALTFDDGPTPKLTDAILDRLAAESVEATFFMIGRHARAHPDIARRVLDAGHLIANHTEDHHRTGLFRRDRYWRDQLSCGGESIQHVTGVRPRHFRPPMGFTSPHVLRAAAAESTEVITWSRRGLDTVTRSAPRIAQRVLRGVRAGDIIALHDGVDGDRKPPTATPDAVSLILSGLRRRGLRPVRLDELLRQDHV